MIDLNDIALFVQVVKARSFAEAARRIGIPSNTASRRVQQLEAQLGVRLFHRSTRRLTLTDAGETLYARCADQVESLADVATDLSDGSRSPSGKVRVAAPADFFNWFQMSWVSEFLKTHPKVSLEFVLNDARADLVAEGIDLAIRSGKSLEPTLVARRIGTSRALLVASPAYLAEHGTPRLLDDLTLHDCLAAQPAAGRAVWRLDGPGGTSELNIPPNRVRVNSAHALVKAAIAGLGIALLPEMMVATALREHQLVEVLPGFGVEGIDLFVVYLSRRQQPRAVSVFAEFAIEKIVTSGLVRTIAAPPTRKQRG